MYHRLINIYIAANEFKLKSILEEIPPLENFSHQFYFDTQIEIEKIKQSRIIILDCKIITPDILKNIYSAKDDQALIIGCFAAEEFSDLAENYHLFDRIWTMPLAKERIESSFTGILKLIKEQEDAVINLKYLDTLIDSLPDLIWFKDARGAHLKVNNSFCKAVNKTKKQIEGRGHYYIWDIEPDEYAKGEYICLESEEIVINKRETCLFDETVKCGNNLRKFKTYKSPVFDKNNDVIGTVGLAHDVTDLLNLAIELNILVESLPFAVAVTDKDRIITTVNKELTDNMELESSDLIGKAVDFFLNENSDFIRDKNWIMEKDDENSLLLNKDKVIKIREEKLLDVFGILAGYIYLFMDITLEHQYKNKLLIDANTDHLTKLNNRRSLHDFMITTPCQQNTVLLIADLDNFKEINDQFGHDEGDRVLVEFSDILKQTFPAENLFRLGGDEFAIILNNINNPDKPKKYADQLLASFNTKLAGDFSHTNISVSIGIAMDTGEDKDFGELFKRADMALYESKKSGKNTWSLWDNKL